MSKPHRRISDEVTKELAEIEMAAKVAKAKGQLRVAVNFKSSFGPDLDALEAFQKGEDYQGYVGKGKNRRLKFEVKDNALFLHGHRIAEKTKTGIKISNAGFDTPLTYSTFKEMGINAERTPGGRVKLHNKEIDATSGQFVHVPNHEISNEPIRAKSSQKQRSNRTVTEQSNFRAEVFDREIKEQGRGKGELPLSTTQIQPEDQKAINKITGVKSKIPREQRSTQAHHIFPVSKNPEMRNISSQGIGQTRKEHKELHDLNDVVKTPEATAESVSRRRLRPLRGKLQSALDRRSDVGLGIVSPGGMKAENKLKLKRPPTNVKGTITDDQVSQPEHTELLKKKDRMIKIRQKQTSPVSRAKQLSALEMPNEVIRLLKKDTPRREQLVPTTLKSTFLAPNGEFVNSVGDRHDDTAKKFALDLGIELTGGNLDDDAANEQLQRKTGLIRTQNRINKPLMADVRGPVTPAQLKTLREFAKSDQGIFVSVKHPETGEQVGAENERDLVKALRNTNQLQGKCKPCTQMKVSKSKLRLAQALIAKTGQERVDDMIKANKGEVPTGTFGFVNNKFSEVNADPNPDKAQLDIRKKAREEMKTQDDETLNFVSRTAGVQNMESLPLLMDEAIKEGFNPFPGGFVGERGQEYDVGIAVNTKLDTEIQKYLQMPALNDPMKNQESSLSIRPDLTVEFIQNKKFRK